MLSFHSIKTRKPYIPILVVFSCLLTVFLLPFAIHADTQSRIPGNDFASAGYKEQIRFIDMEIKQLQKNMEFLQFKIEQMESDSRFVPPKMRESIKFKLFKLKSLRSLRKRYETLIHKEGGNPVPQHSSTPISHGDQTPGTANINPNHTEIMAKVSKAGLSDWLEPLPGKGCTCLETRLPILFSSGSAKIPRGYKSFLKKLAQFIKDYDVRILIKGYADTDPINTRQYPSNLELGASRASAIARALMTYGIKPSVFEVTTTGEYRFASKEPVKWKKLQRHAVIRILFPNCR